MAKTQAAETPTYQRKGKVNLELRRFRDKDGNVVNKSIVGLYWRKFGRPHSSINEQTGEIIEKELVTLVMIDPVTKEKFGIFEDGGLRNALADLQPGDFVEIEVTGTQNLGNGKRCNVYDVYYLEKPAGLELPKAMPAAAMKAETAPASV